MNYLVKTNLKASFIIGLVLLLGACSSPATNDPENNSTPATAIPTEVPAEELPIAIDSAMPVQDEVDNSTYWTVRTDPSTGVQFTLPCYWESDFAEGGYSLRNYPYSYAESFPRSNPDDLWASGGIKIDIGFMISEGRSLQEYAASMFGNDTNAFSATEVQFNGQTALEVTSEGDFGTNIFYLFDIANSDLVMLFGSLPDAYQRADVQNILNTIVVDPALATGTQPNGFPESPPEGLAFSCLPTN